MQKRERKTKVANSLWRITLMWYHITYSVTDYELLPYAENEPPLWFQQVT